MTAPKLLLLVSLTVALPLTTEASDGRPGTATVGSSRTPESGGPGDLLRRGLPCPPPPHRLRHGRAEVARDLVRRNDDEAAGRSRSGTRAPAYAGSTCSPRAALAARPRLRTRTGSSRTSPSRCTTPRSRPGSRSTSTTGPAQPPGPRLGRPWRSREPVVSVRARRGGPGRGQRSRVLPAAKRRRSRPWPRRRAGLACRPACSTQRLPRRARARPEGAEQVIAKSRTDGSDVPWSGSVPQGPCYWKGTNPGMPRPRAEPLLLSSPSEFRPPTPPACDSPEVAAEATVVRTFPGRS